MGEVKAVQHWTEITYRHWFFCIEMYYETPCTLVLVRGYLLIRHCSKYRGYIYGNEVCSYEWCLLMDEKGAAAMTSQC